MLVSVCSHLALYYLLLDLYRLWRRSQRFNLARKLLHLDYSTLTRHLLCTKPNFISYTLLSPIYRSVLSNYCCPDSVLERRAPAYSVDAPITITSSDLSEDDLLSSYSGSFLSSFPDLLCIVRSRTASTSPSSTRSWVHRNVGDRR
nr:unnamed protein product [Haemonchus contortus]